jgi:ubiquinone/menaquinone biosynthesis C-methylase UbiE
MKPRKIMSKQTLFDAWPERYDRWFTTPIGRLVREVEGELINSLLEPHPGEKLLDAGCGTGIFTMDFLKSGAQVIGLDISAPMLIHARRKLTNYAFYPVQADILHLPFAANSFDKTVSVTALEFIADARRAIDELFRVTRPGGLVVVATLNSLSPWAERRQAKTKIGQRHILENAFFRCADDLLVCSPVMGITRTAVHFQKDDEPSKAMAIEQRGRAEGPNTGAFVAVRWQKPLIS